MFQQFSRVTLKFHFYKQKYVHINEIFTFRPIWKVNFAFMWIFSLFLSLTDLHHEAILDLSEDKFIG